jgi:dynactin-5
VIQSEVIIRGDLLRTYPPSNPNEKGGNTVAVAIGRYCFFSKGCALRPPGKLYKGYIFPFHVITIDGSSHNTRRQFSHYPLKIADHVFVGPSSIIEAALIGSHVNIGANCIIGKFVIIKDYVRILDGTVVPSNMIIPAFSVVAGRPAQVVDEVKEGEVEGLDLKDLYRSVGNHVVGG